MKFHLYETCAGSAALTMRLMGAKRTLVPYQGNKWRVSRQLVEILEERGFTELQSVLLNDPGPWGPTWMALGQPQIRTRVTEILRAFCDLNLDPVDLFKSLRGNRSPFGGELGRAPHWIASFLFLQRLSAAGRSIGHKDERWQTAGCNRSSAYGTPATEKFGAVRPMLPALVEMLEAMDGLKWPECFVGSAFDLEELLIDCDLFDGDPTSQVDYIDPPYVRTTGFNGGHTLSREAVVRFARERHAWGAFVLISEGEPIMELVDEGWEKRLLRGPPKNKVAGWSRVGEWVTLSPRPK